MLNSVLLNRYRIEAQLGQGGMGTVYRGYDLRLKRVVAIKMLSVAGLGAEGQARLLAEAQTAARLNHPNIVAIYDTDVAEGVPFIVMELVAGKTLQHLPPVPMPETLRLAAAIAEVLAHAHAQGIVHRDLKPDNIMLTESGTVKLMDFGLARVAEAPRLTAEGALVGTVAYLAPELIMGGEASPQSDLYALGVLLYELLTGQLPFTGDLMTMLAQHLHAPVVPPSTHQPDLPAALDALVLQLLQKAPTERPASAAAVAEQLNVLLAGGTEAAPAPVVTGIERLARGRLVARAQELQAVLQMWQQAQQGKGGVLLISGEPGIGKTRLVREVMTRAELGRGQVWLGECYADGSAPYAPLAQFLQAPSLQPYLQALPNLVLADLIAIAPGLRVRFPEVPLNPALEPQAEQQRLFEHFCELLTTCAAQAPVLWVLDDAHWADSGTLNLVRYVARRLQRVPLPVLMVLTYREVELAEARLLHAVLSDLQREQLGTRLKLQRFTQAETETLLQTLLAEAIPPEFLTSIYHETEGNPFFVEELCKALIEEGQLTREHGQWQRPNMKQLRLPQSVRVAIEARVGKLPPTTQEVLRLAALLGRKFEFAVLRAAAEQDEEALIEALEQAEKAQLLSEVSAAGEGTFAFAHALIPTTLAEAYSGLRRRRLHKRIVKALETLRPDDYEALAHHCAQAADDERARAFYRKAADRARAVYAHEDAVRCYAELQGLLTEQVALIDLHQQWGEVLDINGQWAQAEQHYRAGLALAEKAGNEAAAVQLLLGLGALAQRQGDLVGALAWLTQASGKVAPMQGQALHVNVVLALGYVHRWLGHDDQAQTCFETGLTLARALGEPKILVLALNGWGLFLTERRSEVARPFLEEGWALAQQIGDKQLHAQVSNSLGWFFGSRGCYAAAQTYVSAQLTFGQAAGDPVYEITGLRQLGFLGEVRGLPLSTAKGYYVAALKIARPLQTKVELYTCLTNLTHLHLFQGDYETAQHLSRELQALAHQTDLSPMLFWVMLNTCDLAIAIGDLPAARQWLAECQPAFEKMTDKSFLLRLNLAAAVLATLESHPLEAQQFEAVSVATLTTLSDLLMHGRVLLWQGFMARQRGESRRAEQHYLQVLQQYAPSEYRGYDVPRALAGLASVWATQPGKQAAGVRLAGASAAWFKRLEAVLFPIEQKPLDAALAEVRAALGETAFAAAWAEGEVMTVETALAEVVKNDA